MISTIIRFGTSARSLRVRSRSVAFTSLIRTSRPTKNSVVSSRSAGTLVPFKLADIGEGIAEVELMKWFVKEGDSIKSFDRICEVQSDKATVEITSRYDGKISKVHHSEGSIVKVGSALVDIITNSTEAPQSKLTSESINTGDSTIKEHVIPFKLADIGEGIAEVELMKWFVKEGDSIKSFDRICEVQSDKATVEITSRYDGKISKVHHSEGSIVKVGSALVDIRVADKSPSFPPELALENKPVGREGSVSSSKIQTTPSVRRLAKENSIDLSLVQGTGPRGRIVKEDVLNFISSTPARNVAPFTPTPSPLQSAPQSIAKPVAVANAPLSQTSKSEYEDKRVPIRGIQRLMVKSMAAANQVKHLTLGEEINCNKLVQLRKSLKSSLSAQQVKMSYLPIILKATSLALLQFPMLNASVNDDATEMVYHANHNIGVAMDTPRGLIVPVIRQVQKKSIFELAIELTQLQDAAMKGAITEAQLSGGTFSLSNIGSIGGTYAVPVLVVPQVCIGAFGRMMTVPRYVSSAGSINVGIDEVESGSTKVEPVTVLNVSWSADHRVVDGATVAKFSNTWKAYIESPDTLLAALR